jgi:Rrf2 family protein
MIFSKSFGYALRGILYVAAKQNTANVQLDEMAEALGVPRHFMGKIMKRVVQTKILDSQKGPTGGFYINDHTHDTKLIEVFRITDHPEDLEQCVLARGKCNSANPCRLHEKVYPLKGPINDLLFHTTVGDLLHGNNETLLQGLTVSVSQS